MYIKAKKGVIISVAADAISVPAANRIIDPDKLMLSTLQCEVGRINKFNANADKWALFHVKKLNPNQQVIQAKIV